MQLWQFLVVLAVVAALIQTIVQYRSKAPATVRVLVAVAAWLMPPLFFVVFHLVVPEQGAITIF